MKGINNRKYTVVEITEKFEQIDGNITAQDVAQTELASDRGEERSDYQDSLPDLRKASFSLP